MRSKSKNYILEFKLKEAELERDILKKVIDRENSGFKQQQMKFSVETIYKVLKVSKSGCYL